MADVRVRRVYMGQLSPRASGGNWRAENRRYAGEGPFRVNIAPGLTEWITSLAKKLGKDAAPILALAAYREGQHLLSMIEPHVPISTPEEAAKRGRTPGQLRASGRVTEPALNDKFQYVNIIYGGEAGSGRNTLEVGYAVWVHEDLYAKHPIGKAKFVEDVVRDQRYDSFDRMEAAFLKMWTEMVKTTASAAGLKVT